MKRFFALLTVLCATATLLGCFSKKPAETINSQPLTTIIYRQETLAPSVPETQYIEPQTVQNDTQPAEPITEAISDTAPLIEPDTVPSAVVPQESTTMGKTGDMAFSDSSDNRYISSVATKYGLNSANLVVLYTVPENDSNIVLEFDGSKDASGKLIRTEKTLVAIYSIDRNLNSKCASKDSAKNEYPYGEMMVMFMTTTKYIMPEFEGQF